MIPLEFGKAFSVALVLGQFGRHYRSTGVSLIGRWINDVVIYTRFMRF